VFQPSRNPWLRRPLAVLRFVPRRYLFDKTGKIITDKKTIRLTYMRSWSLAGMPPCLNTRIPTLY
jgi:hypothetical protein